MQTELLNAKQNAKLKIKKCKPKSKNDMQDENKTK